MPRQPRIEGAGLIHHVTGHSIHEQLAFPDDRSRRGFVSLLGATSQTSGWSLLAYCLLPTHYHFLLETAAPNLGIGMRAIHGRHTRKANARLGRTGPLWRDRFHSTVVHSGPHVVRAAAYIDANPVAAGIVDDPADWLWSSYRANAGLAEPWAWHRRDLVYRHLGAPDTEGPAVYRELVATTVERIHAGRDN